MGQIVYREYIVFRGPNISCSLAFILIWSKFIKVNVSGPLDLSWRQVLEELEAGRQNP